MVRLTFLLFFFATSLMKSSEVHTFMWKEIKAGKPLIQDTITYHFDSSLVINDFEKAAIIRSVSRLDYCDWDKERNEDRSNLLCDVLSKLDIKYKCSDEYKSLLKGIFKSDTNYSKSVDNCEAYASGAPTIFAYLEGIRYSWEDELLKVEVDIYSGNLREDYFRHSTDINTFRLVNNELVFLKNVNKTVPKKCNLDYLDILRNIDSTNVIFSKETDVFSGRGQKLEFSHLQTLLSNIKLIDEGSKFISRSIIEFDNDDEDDLKDYVEIRISKDYCDFEIITVNCYYNKDNIPFKAFNSLIFEVYNENKPVYIDYKQGNYTE